MLGNNRKSGSVQFYDFNGVNQNHFQLRKGSLWTLEWSSTFEMMSLGVSNGCLLVDTTTNKSKFLFTNNSDVFAQQFNSQNNLLFNGSRDGKIRTVDLRASPQTTSFEGSHCPILKHQSSICALKLLKDENYLISSSYDGVVNSQL